MSNRVPSEEEIRRTMTRRPGGRSGVYGLSYWGGGGYLNPQQFGYGYTTSQAYEGGSGGGSVTTTGGAEGGAGGDGGGGAA